MQLSNVLETYKHAVETKDVDLMMSLYCDDIHMYDCWEDWQYIGKDRVRKMVVEWFSGIKEDESVTADFINLHEKVSDKVAFIHCDVKFSGINNENVVYKSVTNRFTFCLINDGSWRIQHQHSSLPTE